MAEQSLMHCPEFEPPPPVGVELAELAVLLVTEGLHVCCPSTVALRLRSPVLLKLRVSIVFTVGFPSGTVHVIFPPGGAPFPFVMGTNFVAPESICQNDIESVLSKPTDQLPG